MARRRVGVTGLGLVSCLGHDYDTVVDALRAGRSGVRAMHEWTSHGLRSPIAGAIDNLDEKKQAAELPNRLVMGMSDAALYCALAALDARRSSGLTSTDVADDRTACIIGSGVGSVDAVYQAAHLYYADRLRRAHPYTVLRSMSSCCSAVVANLLGIRGRSYSLSSACSTSAHNIGHAYELIREGLIDRAFCGGGEDVTELITAAFETMRLALSTKYIATPREASRPFDTGRDGFVISGGAGIVVLEDLEAAERRGARVRAEIRGFAATSDGYDLVLPDPEAVQASACMTRALADAGIGPEEVDYLNVHATSTAPGDIAEVRALERVFGDRLPPFSSTKSMTGHPIGAAGALELIFCIAMLEQSFMAPSINVFDPDPVVIGKPLVTRTCHRPLKTVMSNNFGFGGTNASMVLGHA